LRQFVAGILPDWCIPSVYVAIDRLPLTVNGKLDRAALLLADGRSIPVGGSSSGPRNDIESMLVPLWAEVLGMASVGVEDNFFDLGGHSLLATRLVSRIGKAWGVSITVRDLLERQTIAALAQCIADRGTAGEEEEPLERAPRDGDLPLSFPQQRLWLNEQFDAGNAFNAVAFTLRLHGRVDVRALERSFRRVIDRHESLRTTIRLAGERAVQVISDDPSFHLASRCPLGVTPGEREDEARGFVAAEVSSPFDLANGPLLRAALIRIEDDDHILVVAMHHIVADGWSMSILIRELVEAYSSFVRGESPRPAPLPVQYADYAVWQRRFLAGERLQRLLAYWTSKLRGRLPTLLLPGAWDTVAVGDAGAIEQIALPLELGGAAARVAQQHQSTLFMVLLAAFKSLLFRCTGVDDIVVGTPVANRARPEIEDLIGFFANTLVLRTDVSSDPTFIEVVYRVRDTALGAFAHQDLPIERLVEELRPLRHAAQSPLFQIAFVLQNTPTESYELPGLAVTPAGLHGSVDFRTQLDLTLCLWDTAEGLRGYMEYKTGLYERAAIRRLIAQFEGLLAGAVARPWARLSELALSDRAGPGVEINGGPRMDVKRKRQRKPVSVNEPCQN
jgi:hypothetical protein